MLVQRIRQQAYERLIVVLDQYPSSLLLLDPSLMLAASVRCLLRLFCCGAREFARKFLAFLDSRDAGTESGETTP